MYDHVLLMLVLFRMQITVKKEGEGIQKFSAKCIQENRKSFVDTPLLNNFLGCQFKVTEYFSELSLSFPVKTDQFLSSISFSKGNILQKYLWSRNYKHLDAENM